MTTRIGLACAAMLLALGLLGPAHGGGGMSSILESKMRGLARKVADIPLDRKEKAVALGPIAGPADTPGGTLVQALLARHLAGFGIAIERDAEVLVNGKYAVVGDSSRLERLEVKIELTVREVTGGKVLAKLEEAITHRGNEDLLPLLGLNVDLWKHTNATPEDRNTVLAGMIEKSPLLIEGTKVRTGKDSRFWLEVMNAGKTGVKAYGVNESEGRAFVAMKPGDPFALRLNNDTKFDAVVVLFIDGVPLHQFDEPANKAADGLRVEAGKTLDVTAWPLGGGKSEAFRADQLRSLPRAGFLRPAEKMGTITAMFYPTWEQEAPKEFGGPRCGSATPIRLNIGGKNVKWNAGPLLEAVTVRYKKD